MSDKKIYADLAINVLKSISEVYWTKMVNYISENNINHKDVNCFILHPESMIIYFGNSFIAIEYCGDPFKETFKSEHQREIIIRDFTKDKLSNKEFIGKIVGIKSDGTSNISLPLYAGVYEDLIIPTNAGMDKLIDLKWNFAGQNSTLNLNTMGLDIAEGQFVRLINCSFFDEHNGDLKTRLVKWIDFIPCIYIESEDGDYDKIAYNTNVYEKLWQVDMLYKYPKPDDFKYKKLPQINRFIEKYASSDRSEVEITSFLAKEQNKFILTMCFMGTDILGELECEWQSDTRDKIRPDFFVLRANGYADILEFKLPFIKSKSVVGKSNREHFSSEISTYIAQTRVYATYFDDPNNRKWFEKKYGFKVYKPKRYLVVGRRIDFDYDEWIEIKSDFSNLEIITYDDLVDTVMTQFYL